ncbi:MAG: GNAT family N-acetyltransferase [Acidobacteria bacterium]|nr:GNAT family N-acetyltransferase [Acidobacteriota bacterium]
MTVRRETFFVNGYKGIYLNEVYVKPADRGRGVARSMLDEVTRAADRHGRNIFLEPLASDGLDRDALVAWYTRLGFRRIGSTIYMRTPRPTLRQRLARLLEQWTNTTTRNARQTPRAFHAHHEKPSLHRPHDA